MERSHKIRMYPNNRQETMLLKTAGTSRYAFNWALSEWNRQYEEFKNGRQAERPTAYNIKKQWNAEKEEWAQEVYSGAPTQAILNLGAAFTNFFRHTAEHPKFHKKGRGVDSFYVANDKGAYKPGKVRIPNAGWVKLAEELRLSGKITSYHVSTYAGKWWVSIHISNDEVKITSPKTVCGIDVGLKVPATASDGTTLQIPGQLKALHSKLKREQRRLARKQPRSRNRDNQLIRKQRVELRIGDIRRDVTHKFTTQVCKNHATVVIEDLSIEPMKRTSQFKSFRQAFQQSMMSEVLRQLEYKAQTVKKAPKYYPSSQLCSACGARMDMPVDVRTYRCEHCGAVIDRDLNAAINLMKIG